MQPKAEHFHSPRWVSPPGDYTECWLVEFWVSDDVRTTAFRPLQQPISVLENSKAVSIVRTTKRKRHEFRDPRISHTKSVVTRL